MRACLATILDLKATIGTLSGSLKTTYGSGNDGSSTSTRFLGKNKRMRNHETVHQQLISKHTSIGCLVTHCGVGSLTEALVISECQLVLLPQGGDQFFNARLMSGAFKVEVEVERREDDGFFTKEAVYEAAMASMEREHEVGKDVKDNHARWRELVQRDGFEESYINGFIRKLQDMLD